MILFEASYLMMKNSFEPEHAEKHLLSNFLGGRQMSP